MATWADWLLQWIKQPGVAVSLTVGSVALLVASLLLAPRTLARLPPDYLVRRRDRAPRSIVQRLACAARNLVAALLLVAGLAMLVLPGQGLLTVLVGLLLLDVPGKRRLLRRILSRPSLRTTVDRLRERAGQPPLILDLPADAARGSDPGERGG